MGKIALVTGASSGFGRMIARDLGEAGFTSYASMRGTTTKNAEAVADIAAEAATKSTFAPSKSTCRIRIRSTPRSARSSRSTGDWTSSSTTPVTWFGDR